jgi:hypothetical protein
MDKNIINYYSMVDNNIDDKSKNTDIKNLINLSTFTDINKKKNNRPKNKKRLLKECDIKNNKTLEIINLVKLNTNEEYIECYSND